MDVFFGILLGILHLIGYLSLLLVKKYIFILLAIFILLFAGFKWGKNIRFTGRNIIMLLSLLACIALLVFAFLHIRSKHPYHLLMKDLRERYSIYKVEIEQDAEENLLVFTMFVKGMNVGPGGRIDREELEILRPIQNEFIAGINEKEVAEYLKNKYSILKDSDVAIQLQFANQSGSMNLLTVYYGDIRSDRYSGNEWFGEENKKVQQWSYYDLSESGEYNREPTYISYTEILEELDKKQSE